MLFVVSRVQASQGRKVFLARSISALGKAGTSVIEEILDAAKDYLVPASEEFFERKIKKITEEKEGE